MTWTANHTVPAGEQFDENDVDLSAIPEKYEEDAKAALDLVPVLDGSDDVVRQVNLSGYRSEQTSNISVSVTRRPNAG